MKLKFPGLKSCNKEYNDCEKVFLDHQEEQNYVPKKNSFLFGLLLYPFRYFLGEVVGLQLCSVVVCLILFYLYARLYDQ